MTDKEDHAFPQYDCGYLGKGMTLRDYFAAQALAGLLSANAIYNGATNDRTAIAADAYAHADAMLAARKQPPE